MSDPAPIALSHSAFSTYDTCPLQYEGKYVTKEVKFVQSAEAKWGDDVHLALEKYGADGTPLPSNMEGYKSYIDAVMARPGRKVFEGAVALDHNARPCGYYDKDANKRNLVWLRAKIDVINFRDELRRAEIFDWKTGSVKNDPEQLVMYAMMVFLHHPGVDEVRAGYAWLKQPLHQAFTEPTTFKRAQLPQLIEYYRKKTADIEHATEVGAFPPKPSGLCRGWCAMQRCAYYEPPRKK